MKKGVFFIIIQDRKTVAVAGGVEAVEKLKKPLLSGENAAGDVWGRAVNRAGKYFGEFCFLLFFRGKAPVEKNNSCGKPWGRIQAGKKKNRAPL